MSYIVYQIQPQEVRDDGTTFYPSAESPQASFTQSDPMGRAVQPNADKYTAFGNTLLTWNNFEMNSDQSIQVSFWDSTGTTKYDEFPATYLNIISLNNTRVIKYRNISGTTANITWSFYG